MAMSWKTIFCIVLISALIPPLIPWRDPKLQPASTLEPQFNEGDLIPLFVNIAFRSRDGCEVQSYFDLPFCPPGDPILNRKKTLKDIVSGDCYTRTQYELKFRVDTVRKILCEKNLTIDEVKTFRHAISKQTDYEMSYSNNFPWTSPVGFATDESLTIDSRTRYYLVKHIDFYAHYCESQVVSIYSRPEENSVVDITEDAENRVKFTYSVYWIDYKANPIKPVSWNHIALKKDSKGDSLVHCGGMLCFWLLGLVIPIASYLKKYLTRHPPEVGIPHQIHGDVCWRPPYLSLFAAIVGNGTQQLIMILLLFALSNRGVLFSCHLGVQHFKTYILAIYCFTSQISGYTATLFHSRYKTQGSRECIFQTAVLYILPVGLTAVVAHIADSLYPPFRTLIACGLGASFFVTLGGIFGHKEFEIQETCTCRRTQNVVPWWESALMSTPAQILLGGLFPFVAVLRNMDELYASLWLLKICGAFSTVLTSLISVIMLTILMAVIFTSFQLYREDFNWWWRSVFRGGSTAIFMFAYGLYFHYRVNGDKYSGTFFIFTCYNACFCYALFLVLGTLSFFASSFVHSVMNPVLHKRE